MNRFKLLTRYFDARETNRKIERKRVKDRAKGTEKSNERYKKSESRKPF